MKSTQEIPLFKVYMSQGASTFASDILHSGFIGQGPIVDQYEDALSKYFTPNPLYNSFDYITVNSATSAEHLIYHMLKNPADYHVDFGWGYAEKQWHGLNNYSEVLTTPLTCTATNWPILLNNLKLKWVDVDPNTCNMDLDDLHDKINANTRIVTVVHWGGNPIDYFKLSAIVTAAENKYGHSIFIVEDCAHAMGAKYDGTSVGALGNLATFSTQAIKHLTTVDGGFIVSPYMEFNKRARLLRWYGIDRDDKGRTDFRCETDIPEIGFKFHMNDVNAGIGLQNLYGLNEQVIDKHKSNGKYYNEHLQNIPGLELMTIDKKADPSYWLYTIKVERRDDFMKYMKSKGIQVSRVHERNDKHTCTSAYKTYLPKLNSFIDNMICIPVGWWVTNEQREYIVDSIKNGW